MPEPSHPHKHTPMLAQSSENSLAKTSSEETSWDEATQRKAYNQMITRIGEYIEDAEAYAYPSLQHAISMAARQAVHLGEINTQNAETIGHAIKRDISDAAETLMETSQEFNEWLKQDIRLVERKVLSLFLSVARQTRSELSQLTQTHPPEAHK